MSRAVSRMRMFAGPNGSGKSTVFREFPAKLVGVYVNPDDIEAAARQDGRLPLAPFEITAHDAEVREAFTTSAFLQSQNLAADAKVITCRDNVVDFGGLAVNSYHASVLSDFLRRKLIAAGVSFTFETVMSAPDKVELLREARAAGFRTYLYFVATERPSINVARVQLRVQQGGHGVPEAKIVERYHRSLGLLWAAVQHTDRAFFFDTSDDESSYFATITSATTLEFTAEEVPAWFRAAVWDKF